MFNDIGVLEIVTLVVLAVIVFGPEKLPKLIQDASRFIRKVREFSESAKEDIRTELGPEFKDFEFEDLNPKTFVRKQLMENDDLGLKEIRSSFDLRKEMSEPRGRRQGPGERHFRHGHTRRAGHFRERLGGGRGHSGPAQEARRARSGRAPSLRRRHHLSTTNHYESVAGGYPPSVRQ